MDQHLTLEGRSFDLLGVQRKGNAVYRGVSEFLRIGPKQAIAEDLSFHRQMEKAGYPVAQILSEGEHEGRAYFIEQSLGDRSFRSMFAEEFSQNQTISDTSFDTLVGTMRIYANAQLSVASGRFNSDELATAIRLDVLTEEMPQYASRLRAAYEKAVSRLEKYPKVVTHGDLNPSNMYPNGIIDLEDSFYGPLGFDIVSVLMTQEWFPEGEYEYTAKYKISDVQKERAIAEFDVLFFEKNVPKLSDAYNDFAFCRAIWLCAGMGEWPKIQKWRFEKLVHEHLF